MSRRGTRSLLATLATSCLLSAACGASDGSGGGGAGTESGTTASPDGGAGETGGSAARCSKCDQGLALALAEQTGVESLLCPGAAVTAWLALEGCMQGRCASTCTPGPFSDCLVCLEGPDGSGGCETELAACEAR